MQSLLKEYRQERAKAWIYFLLMLLSFMAYLLK